MSAPRQILTRHLSDSRLLKHPMGSRFVLTLLLLCGFGAFASDALLGERDDVGSLVGWLLDEHRDLTAIPFPEVVKAATGRTVIPLNLTNAEDRVLLDKIESTLGKVLHSLNATNHSAHQERRINEVSAHFEKALMEELNSIPGFTCAPPKNALGRVQRSGYPDLRLVDETSGQIIYLDPKLYAKNNRNSTLRTFYFEPKRETNKILDDAHHLLVGFEHEGRVNGKWRFTNWEIVDLSRFKVRLKAEFQGSNRDLYQPEATVGSSRD